MKPFSPISPRRPIAPAALRPDTPANTSSNWVGDLRTMWQQRHGQVPITLTNFLCQSRALPELIQSGTAPCDAVGCNAIIQAFVMLNDTEALTLFLQHLPVELTALELTMRTPDELRHALQTLETGLLDAPGRRVTLTAKGEGMSIPKDLASRFADLLARDTPLARVVITFCDVGSPSLGIIIDAFKHSTCVNSLELSALQMTNQGADRVSAMLEVNTALTELCLADNKITHFSLTGTHLTQLDLRANRLTDDSVIALGQALKHNQTLRHLHLANQKPALAELTSEFLLDALSHNTTLTHLDYGQNRCSIPAAHTMAALLRSNALPLRDLRLAGCELGNEGCRVLLDALASNTHLHHLDLANNGARLPHPDAVLPNQTLKTLSLAGNKVAQGASAAPALESLSLMLHLYGGLEELDLSECQIGDAGTTRLSAALGNAQNLKLLNLSRNQIGPRGLRTLLEALPQRESLTSLNVSTNSFTASSALPVLEEGLLGLRRPHLLTLTHSFQKAPKIDEEDLQELRETFAQHDDDDESLTLDTLARDLPKAPLKFQWIGAYDVFEMMNPDRTPVRDRITHLLARNMRFGDPVVLQRLEDVAWRFGQIIQIVDAGILLWGWLKEDLEGLITAARLRGVNRQLAGRPPEPESAEALEATDEGVAERTIGKSARDDEDGDGAPASQAPAAGLKA